MDNHTNFWDDADDTFLTDAAEDVETFIEITPSFRDWVNNKSPEPVSNDTVGVERIDNNDSEGGATVPILEEADDPLENIDWSNIFETVPMRLDDETELTETDLVTYYEEMGKILEELCKAPNPNINTGETNQPIDDRSTSVYSTWWRRCASK